MGPWEFALVTLGAYRLWRIVARDSITADAREALTGYDDAHAPGLNDAPRKTWRVYLSALIRCAWCLGAYVSVAAYACWYWWPRATLIVLTPLAVSATLGLLRKNLDQDE